MAPLKINIVQAAERKIGKVFYPFMFEPATTLNTGNANSDLTVAELERL